ncbi:MAG: ParB/RepB/Spo0J family partition protein [Planctomycetaceae bacterium]
MGARVRDEPVQLSPVSSPRDIGRRRLRNIGTIPIERVIPDPEQPRSEFSEEALARLADSIRSKGQLLPIHVRWSEGAARWVIVSGERRWRATQVAGLKTVDCYFADDGLSESDILEQQLVENLLREDLRPIEEARAFEQLMKLNGWNGNQVAEALHVPASKVSRALALLDLPEDMQQQIDAGQLPARSAYELAKLPDDGARRALAAKVAGGMTSQETAKVVREHRQSKKQKRRPGGTKLDFWAENGWKITLASKGKGNYHEVEEALLEALDEVRLRINSNVQIF